MIVDLDGTLIKTGEKKLHPDVINILTKLNKKKQLILNTARHPIATKFVLDSQITFVPTIALNGAALYVTNWEKPETFISIPKTEVDSAIDLALKANVTLSIYTLSNWYVTRIDDYVNHEAFITEMTPQLLDKSVISGDPCLKLTALAEHSKLELYANALSKNTNLSFFKSNNNYIEICSSGVDKSTLIPKYFMRTKRIRDDFEISYFGDSYNDIPAAEYSDKSYSFSYSPTKLRKISQTIFDFEEFQNIPNILYNITKNWP